MISAETRRACAELFGPDDVAELFGVSKQTIYLWLKAGRLPKPFRVGRTVRWRRDVILALLEPADSAPQG